MCGIAGKLTFNHTAVSETLLRAMCEKLIHRGPDAQNTYAEKNIGLAHTRLSIIDLSNRGIQPMSDTTGRYKIIFNGEIYNFLELRKELESSGIHFRSRTDTEVIVNLYAKHGVSSVARLRGMFAFAIWDCHEQILFLARDRMGQKPLKYYYNKDAFVFGSELPALFADPDIPHELDWSAIDEYLTHRYIPAPKTAYKNIYKFPPGHWMLVQSNGVIKIQSFWELDYNTKYIHSENEWLDIIDKKIRESVHEQMIGDVPIGIHLSGGIDSGLITAYTAIEHAQPIRTFSIGFPEESHNELPYAKMIAKRYNTTHTEFMMDQQAHNLLPIIATHYDEPFADTSALPTWILAQLTKRYVTVALNGDGADESFAGYIRHITLRNQNDTENMPRIYRDNMRCLDSAEQTALYTDELHAYISKSRAEQFLPNLWKRYDNGEVNDTIMAVETRSYLPDDLMVKVDIAAMIHGLEVRSPFLNHELFELAATMPSNLKIRGLQQKYILRKLAERYLPKNVIALPKRGFGVPLGNWLRTSMLPMIREHLLDPRFISYGFREKTICQMIDTHLYYQQSTGHKLWTLLMLKFWLDSNIK